MEVLYLVIIVEKIFFVNATKYLSSFQKKRKKKVSSLHNFKWKTAKKYKERKIKGRNDKRRKEKK